MGWFSDALNPVKHFKDTKKSIKSLNDGDIMGALDPAGYLSPKQTAAQKLAAAALKKKGIQQPVRDPKYMGDRGPTMSLGGGANGRSYTPNPFMKSPTAQSMAPPPPQTGMAPPPQVGMGGPPQGMPMGKMGGGPPQMPISGPKMGPMPMGGQMPPQGGMDPKQQMMIDMLRSRGGGGAMR